MVSAADFSAEESGITLETSAGSVVLVGAAVVSPTAVVLAGTAVDVSLEAIVAQRGDAEKRERKRERSGEREKKRRFGNSVKGFVASAIARSSKR